MFIWTRILVLTFAIAGIGADIAIYCNMEHVWDHAQLRLISLPMAPLAAMFAFTIISFTIPRKKPAPARS